MKKTTQITVLLFILVVLVGTILFYQYKENSKSKESDLYSETNYDEGEDIEYTDDEELEYMDEQADESNSTKEQENSATEESAESMSETSENTSN